MTEFAIGDYSYRAEKIDTFKALHVARRLSPIVGQLALMSQGTLTPAEIVMPLVEGIAKMSDDDFNYVRDTCLAVVVRVVDGKAYPVFNSSARLLQFQDIRPKQCLEIIVNVVMDNLSDFFDELPNLTTDGTPAQGSPP